MRRLRDVLRLKFEGGHSHRAIAQACSVGVGTVSEYVGRAMCAGLTWPLPEELDDAALEAKLFPPRSQSDSARPLPDVAEIHQELKRDGVTLQLLWIEYLEVHPNGYRYSQFCEHYRQFVKKLKPSMRQVHRAGEKAFVDFSGKRPSIADPKTGEVREVELFVGVLGASSYVYAEAVESQELPNWIAAHVRMFEAWDGSPAILVPDKLKSAVTDPCLYEPGVNRSYAELCSHYGAVSIPARTYHPKDKGSVENAIQHTQGTALKGKRFESIEAQNAWLAHWEERWAAPRIHGRKKRQVLEMFREEQPHLQQLPAERFRFFKQAKRTVDDSGLAQVDGSYYAALPAAPHSEVIVRIYEHEIEILDVAGQLLRRHEKSQRKGSFTLESGDRLFNPSRETARLLTKAEQIGPHTAAFAQQLFARLGRPGQRALYGLANLARTYPRCDIEAVCARLLQGHCVSYSAVKRALEHTGSTTSPEAAADLIQSGPDIRDIIAYQAFWDAHSRTHSQEDTHAHVDA